MNECSEDWRPNAHAAPELGVSRASARIVLENESQPDLGSASRFPAGLACKILACDNVAVWFEFVILNSGLRLPRFKTCVLAEIEPTRYIKNSF